MEFPPDVLAAAEDLIPQMGKEPGATMRSSMVWYAAKAMMQERALFAPILEEKERRDALDREQAETVRFLQHHLDNPQPPSEALKKLFADYQAADIQSVGLDSPFNACCYRDHCKALEARALAAEAALAAEREALAEATELLAESRAENATMRERLGEPKQQADIRPLLQGVAAIRAEGE